MSYPMTDDPRCQSLPDDVRPGPTEYEPDVVAVAIGLYLMYAVQLYNLRLPTADEWAAAHAAYDAAALAGEDEPDILYAEVVHAPAYEYRGMCMILSAQDHTITLGEGADRRCVPLPLAVAERGRQIAAGLAAMPTPAGGLAGTALAEALRSWLAPCAQYVLGIHREGVASMYGD